jgi:hypothetical protein
MEACEMIRDYSDLIKETLRGKTLRPKDLERKLVKTKEMSRSQLFKILDKLCEQGKIKKMKKLGTKQVLYYLAEEEDFLKRKIKHGSQSKITPSDRKKHSDDLKEKVIKPWIDKLPIIDYATIYTYDRRIPQFRYNPDVKEVFEKELLFEDFENHITFQPNPFKLWEEFKELAKIFYGKRDKLYSALIKWIEEKTKLTYSEHWDGTGIMSESFPLFIYRGMFYLHDGNERGFKSEYKEFESRIVETGEVYEYYIGSVGLVRESKNKYDKESLESEMIETIMSMVKEIEGGKYKTEVKEILMVINELRKVESELRITSNLVW